MITIKFKVDGQIITRIDERAPVADSIGFVAFEFDFIGEEWDGLTKTAVISQGGGVPYYSLIDEFNRIEPDKLPVFSAGEWSVGVFGGNLLTANKAPVYFVASGLRDGKTPAPPPPSVYTQVIEALEQTRAAVESKVENDFAPNQTLVSGSDGKAKASQNVSTTLLERLVGVISPIQTQLNAKEPTVNLTPNRAVLSDASGNLKAANVTDTELGHLSGVTGAIQGQINSVSSNVGSTASVLGAHMAKCDNPHRTTKDHVGLGDVENYSPADMPISTAAQAVFDKKADLDESGKVPAAQLPAFVDDVVDGYLTSDTTFINRGGQLVTPETGKIYLDISTNKQYRWGGTKYVLTGSDLALGETMSTAYRGDRGKTAYDHTLIMNGNPHKVTKTDVELGNVDNTSDENKPVSTAQQTALNAKRAKTDNLFVGQLYLWEPDQRYVTEIIPGTTLKITAEDSMGMGRSTTLSMPHGETPIVTVTAPEVGLFKSGEIYGEFNPPKQLPFAELTAVDGVVAWDLSADKASVILTDDAELIITNVYNGAVGLIMVQGGYELILPANSTYSADWDYLTLDVNDYYEYMFVYDGTNYHWTRAVRKVAEVEDE